MAAAVLHQEPTLVTPVVVVIQVGLDLIINLVLQQAYGVVAAALTITERIKLTKQV